MLSRGGRASHRAGGEYGWWIYALPLLLVVSVIAVFDARAGAQRSDASARTSSAPPATVDRPAVTENRAEPGGLKIPTATLPGGGGYTKAGGGTWHVVPPGKTKTVGRSGRVYRYTIVEDGIDGAGYGGDDAFATMVDWTLRDRRGWTWGGNVRFRRLSSPSDADFRISLTSPLTVRRLCGFLIRYESSCYQRSAGRVVINLARWIRGAKSFSADMTAYRQYAINHEVGHALNNRHVGCPQNDALAPVMMQQTYGVQNDYVAKLNAADPANYGAVPADGKICRPNAWPNPHGQ